jgi:hypothetical protein
MIAEDPVLAKIPVDRESQAWNGTVKAVGNRPPGFGSGKKSPQQRNSLQVGNVQAPVIDDIGQIIQMPGGIK